MSTFTNDVISFNDGHIKNEASAPVFVTGGSGLVGSNLLQQLLQAGKHVKALYRKRLPEIPGRDKIEWVQGDILDVIALEEAMQGVEQVYHCAAVVSFNRHNKHSMFKTNIEGTANVVNAALDAGVRKMCYVSSVAALGKPRKGQVVDEAIKWPETEGNSNYGKSKYAAELEVWRGIGEGLKAVIVNPVIILGAGDWNDSSTKMFKTAYDEFPWHTEGATGFVDVKDVVRAMIELTESDITAERFILSAENRKYKDVFSLMAEGFGKRPPYKKVTPTLATIVRYVTAVKAMFTGEEPLLTRETAEAALATVNFDNQKLKKFLPSFSYTPVEETIRRACAELKRREHL